jgi:hypothetical protein
MPSTCPHGNPIPGMPAPEAHHPIPLSLAKTGQALVVDRITEEAEADRQLLRFLWDTGVRPGSRLIVGEVADYAGTISVMLDNRTVTMGLIAAHKIWVYDPADDPERPAVRRPRAAAKAGR